MNTKIIQRVELGKGRDCITFVVDGRHYETIAYRAAKGGLQSAGRIFRQEGQKFTSINPKSERGIKLATQINFALRLADVLDVAAATVELYTGNGARTQPITWPRLANSEIDHNEVARRLRAALAEVQS